MNKYAVFVMISILSMVFAQTVSSDLELISKTETTIKILDSMMEKVKTKELFKVWHYLFKPDYLLSSAEAVEKYKVFKSNLKLIKVSNAKKLSYTLGLNQFSDMTLEEFKKLLTKSLRQRNN